MVHVVETNYYLQNFASRKTLQCKILHGSKPAVRVDVILFSYMEFAKILHVLKICKRGFAEILHVLKICKRGFAEILHVLKICKRGFAEILQSKRPRHSRWQRGVLTHSKR